MGWGPISHAQTPARRVGQRQGPGYSHTVSTEGTALVSRNSRAWAGGPFRMPKLLPFGERVKGKGPVIPIPSRQRVLHWYHGITGPERKDNSNFKRAKFEGHC